MVLGFGHKLRGSVSSSEKELIGAKIRVMEIEIGRDEGISEENKKGSQVTEAVCGGDG